MGLNVPGWSFGCCVDITRRYFSIFTVKSSIRLSMVSFHPIRILLAISLIFLSLNGVRSQTSFFQNEESKVSYFNHLLNEFQTGQTRINIIGVRKLNHSIMLPNPANQQPTPLFCRLENKINEGSKIQCLFRLGSASYVNYLEQKGDRQRLMLEQLR